jgi:hypothetical protein
MATKFGCHQIIAIEGFLSPFNYGDQKPFGRHTHVVTKNLLVVTIFFPSSFNST